MKRRYCYYANIEGAPEKGSGSFDRQLAPGEMLRNFLSVSQLVSDAPLI